MRLRGRFEPAAPGFSLVNAAILARCASPAYCDEPGRELRRRTDLGESICFACPDSDTQGFAGVSALGYGVLAFRGSEPKIADWRNDARGSLIRVPWAPGLVHKGFAGALDCVWRQPAFRRALMLARSSGQPLFLTGHSLGGALAALASVRLVSEGAAPAGVYTFGQPRVGDRDFAAGYPQGLLWRVVNAADLVAALPVGGFWFRGRYAHAGSLVWLDGEGNAVAGPWGERRHLARVKRPRIDMPLHQIIDHGVDRYVDALDLALPTPRRGS